jgi:hypothetical protein
MNAASLSILQPPLVFLTTSGTTSGKRITTKEGSIKVHPSPRSDSKETIHSNRAAQVKEDMKVIAKDVEHGRIVGGLEVDPPGKYPYMTFSDKHWL